jgi:hypothetical protein
MSAKLRPSPAMAVAVAALVFAAGGTSYAVSQLPPNSVGSSQVKKGAVTTPKMAFRSVTRAKLADASVTGRAVAAESLNGGHILRNSLTGAQLEEDSLATVPSARSAGVEALSFKSSSMSTLGPDTVGTGHASCDAGLSPVSGGVRVEHPTSMFVMDSYPEGDGWTAHVANGGPGSGGYTVAVVCAKAGANAGSPPAMGAQQSAQDRRLAIGR